MEQLLGSRLSRLVEQRGGFYNFKLKSVGNGGKESFPR